MKEPAPTVSVVLPTYNREQTLRLAIESVLSQSFSDFELIVIDDGSTDGTMGLLESLRDRRIRTLHLPARLGASGARNVGIDAACGRYVAFQDSDDIWRPQKLAIQVGIMESANDAVAVVYGTIIRHLADRTVRLPRPTDTKLSGDLWKTLAVDNFISLPAALVRVERLRCVGGFDPQLPRFQDWDLWLKLARTDHFQYVDEVLLDSPETPGSITLDRDAYYRAVRLILAKHREVFECVPEAALKYHLQLARGALVCRSPRELLQEIRAAWSMAGWRMVHAALRGGWIWSASLRKGRRPN